MADIYTVCTYVLFCSDNWNELAHMAVHRGEILNNAIREKGITFAAAAKHAEGLRRGQLALRGRMLREGN